MLGHENVIVLVQGKLLGDNTVADAGLVAAAEPRRL